MTWQAVKLQLSIHDHREEASYQMVCEQARYDAHRGVLEYREAGTHAQVKLSFHTQGCRIERQLDSQTHVDLSLDSRGSFSVGAPTLSGESQLNTYQFGRHGVSMRYQLTQGDQLLTDQTLTYSWTPTDA